MKLMKSAAILAAFLSLPTAVLAQLTPGGGGGGGTFTWPGTAGTATGGTTTGGTMPYVNAYITGGTLTASIAGFEPTPAYAQLTVGATSSRVALPTNAGEVVVYNTGVNPAFVQLGNSSVVATASNDVIPAGGWVGFSVGSAVDIAAIETAGATALNISGGAGIPTGSGGGGGISGSNGVAQGSTTSGQLGPLNQVATLTAPPSYSNATTNPLTANTLGGLRVSSEWNSADVYSAPGSITTASTYTGFPAGTVAGSVVRLFNIGPSQLYYTQSTSATTPSATTAMAQLDPYSMDSIVVNPGMSGISAITKNSGQTAGLNMELGTGTSHMTGGPINLAVTQNGVTASFYDLMGAFDNGSLARALQVTAPGTSASNYALAVQGVTAGVPMPVSASTLPLPSGAATAANQEVTAAGTTAASAQAIQGVTGGVPVPVSGSFSASFSQFAPNGNYSTPLTVGSSSTRTALPSGGGTTVAVYNTGSNAAFVALGSSSVAATASDDQVAPGGFLCLAVGSNADIAAIETAGATALNISGGSGGCAGSGGGGGGSNGGTASSFQPTTQGTQISATTIGVTGSLPTGTSGVAQDVGSYPAYCQFGSSATGITSGHYFNGSGAQWAYLVPSGATQMTCEGVSGTTQINFYGGTGLGVDTQSAAYGPQDTTLTAIGTISAADAGATSSTWTNGQTVLTWASAPTTSTLQFPGFSGAETGVLVCYGTAAGTFELDTLMDKASPGHYIAQTITQLVGGASPSKAANFTMSGTTTGVIGKVNLTGAWGAQIRATSYSSGSPTCTLGITTNQADTVVANLLPPGKDANIAITTTTTGTSLVNGVSGQTIHISAYEFKMGSAGPTTFSLAYSTSTSCTSPTTVAGLFPMSIAGDGETIGDGIADVMTMPAGDTLCAVSTGSSVPVGGHVHYTQY